MTNYIEYNGSVAFHPGYYINELVEESGLTQEDFAKRLNTTPKNLSLLIRGKQRLSVRMAIQLSRMLGTSATYWLNLQNAYDVAIEEIAGQEELEREKAVLKQIGYAYFREHFGLPDLPRRTSEQVERVRKFLGVSSLTVFTQRDMAVSFRGERDGLTQANIIKANLMVQIASNVALEIPSPKYCKEKFESAVSFALAQTENHNSFYDPVRSAFLEAGIVLVVLPNLSGSKINGATKRLGKSVMLMVNDRRSYSDTFWFTLFHEVGHVLNGDYGVSFEKEVGEKESAADEYARNALVPPEAYEEFVLSGNYGSESVRRFAKSIRRDPAIVVGRLQNDGYVSHSDASLQALRHRYKVEVAPS